MLQQQDGQLLLAALHGLLGDLAVGDVWGQAEPAAHLGARGVYQGPVSVFPYLPGSLGLLRASSLHLVNGPVGQHSAAAILGEPRYWDSITRHYLFMLNVTDLQY